MSRRSVWIFGLAVIVIGGGFAFSTFIIPHSQAATTPAPFIACNSDADCAVGGTTFNPTSNGINTTVCYYPGTTASYCGTPLSPGETAQTCSFPSSTFNQTGYAAIAVACQAMFGATYDACVTNHQGLDCAYTNQSLAFNCGMPGAGQGGVGYCLPGGQVPGCIATMTETQLATALGASCSDLTPAPPSNQTPPFAPPVTPTKTPSGSTNSITGLQGFNPATGLYTNGTAVQNTYIVLYGYFGATGNEVAIDGNLVVPSYVSTNQLNIPIGDIAVGVHSVVVSSLLLESPESGSASFTVTTSTAGSWATPDALDGPGIETINPAIQNFFSNGGAGSPGASGASGANSTPGAANTTPVANFPVTILVTAASLNVRSASNTTAPLAGSQTLLQGDTFIASNEVTGQSVTEDGVTTALWWVSSLGNYVWSGGTTVEGSATASGGSVTTTGGKGTPLGAQTTASNPSITSAAYSATTGILFIDGTFDPSGNIVSVNGNTLSNNGADQTAITLQIPVVQGSVNSGSYSTIVGGIYTVTVQDSKGTATFSVSPNPVPVLTAVQGYNPTTNVYETSTDVLNPGDTAIILYGSFAPSGNGVTLQWGTAGFATIAPSQTAYQSATQINFSLGSLIPAGVSSFTVNTYDAGGPSKAVSVKVNGVSSGSSVQSVLGGATPTQYLNSLVSSLRSSGYLISESTDTYGEIVGMASKNGQSALYFALGDDSTGNQTVVTGASSASGKYGTQCFVKDPMGNSISTWVAPDGTIPHISNDFKVMVDPSALTDQSLLNTWTTGADAASFQSDIIADFLAAYSPYAQNGFPQPISNASTNANTVVIIAFAHMGDPNIAAQTIVLLPSSGFTTAYVPAGSSNLILNAVNNGKQVAVVTYNLDSSSGVFSDFECTMEHEMGHTLGAGEDYSNGDSPMRSSCNPEVIGLSPNFAYHLKAIQLGYPMSLVGSCGAGYQPTTNVTSSFVPYPIQFTNSGGLFVPITQFPGTNQWAISGSCTDTQLANGAYDLNGLPAGCYVPSSTIGGYPTFVSSADCTETQMSQGGISMSEGCYQPATAVDSSFVTSDNFSDQLPPDKCTGNDGQDYTCAVTSCGAAGQYACPVNGLCQDANGNQIACPNVTAGQCLDANGNPTTCPTVDGFSPPPAPIAPPPPLTDEPGCDYTYTDNVCGYVGNNQGAYSDSECADVCY